MLLKINSMAKEILRKAEVEDLADWVIEKRQIFLLGARGSGKSAVLDELLTRLKGRRTSLVLDLAFVSGWPDFMQRFKTSLQQLAKDNGTLFLHLKRFLEHNPYPLIEEEKSCTTWLESFSRSLEMTGLDVLLVLENLDQEAFLNEQVDAFAAALSSGRTCQLLFSSATDLGLKGFDVYALQPLSAAHFSSALDETEAQLLHYAKGNMQLFQELLLKRENEQTLKELAATVLKPYQRQFLLLKRRFTPMQWKLLCALALDELVPQPHAFEFLVKHYLGAASSVERALSNLKQTGFVEKVEGGWQLTDVYLMRWLQQVYGKM